MMNLKGGGARGGSGGAPMRGVPLAACPRMEGLASLMLTAEDDVGVMTTCSDLIGIPEKMRLSDPGAAAWLQPATSPACSQYRAAQSVSRHPSGCRVATWTYGTNGWCEGGAPGAGLGSYLAAVLSPPSVGPRSGGEKASHASSSVGSGSSASDSVSRDATLGRRSALDTGCICSSGEVSDFQSAHKPASQTHSEPHPGINRALPLHTRACNVVFLSPVGIRRLQVIGVAWASAAACNARRLGAGRTGTRVP